MSEFMYPTTRFVKNQAELLELDTEVTVNGDIETITVFFDSEALLSADFVTENELSSCLVIKDSVEVDSEDDIIRVLDICNRFNAENSLFTAYMTPDYNISFKTNLVATDTRDYEFVISRYLSMTNVFFDLIFPRFVEEVLDIQIGEECDEEDEILPMPWRKKHRVEDDDELAKAASVRNEINRTLRRLWEAEMTKKATSLNSFEIDDSLLACDDDSDEDDQNPGSDN